VKPFDPRNPIAVAAHALPDLGRVAHRAGSLQQRDPHRLRSDGRGAGRHAVAAHNSFDEAIALPTPTSARIARNTQLILQHETGITKVVDPLAGSYYVESLTASLIAKRRKLIGEVEALGGMTSGRSRHAQDAHRGGGGAQAARIDRGEDVIVGVNKFQAKDASPIEIPMSTTTPCANGQVARLHKIRASRHERKCVRGAEGVGRGARNGTGNLLALSIEATRVRATVGEISSALKASMAATRPPSARSPASMPASGKAMGASSASAPTSPPSPRKRAAGRA